MSANPGDPPSQLPKQRVLLVDDSKIVRSTLARLIRKTFDVREEVNGEAAVVRHAQLVARADHRVPARKT